MMQAVVLSSHTAGLGVIRALGYMGVPLTVFYYNKLDMGYVSRFVIINQFNCNSIFTLTDPQLRCKEGSYSYLLILIRRD